jgi:hypothetical protein
MLACGMGLCVLASPARSQQPADDAGRVVVPAARYQPYFIWPEDLHTYKGEYYLSNGKKMFISRLGNRLFARVGQQKEREIIATGEHMFESSDRSMTLNIVISRQGYVSGSIAYHDEDQAGQPLALATLMTR